MLRLCVLAVLLVTASVNNLVLAAPFKSVSVSRTLVISGKPYYIPADPLVALQSPHFNLGNLDVLPIAVFSAQDLQNVGSTIDQWLTTDDVFDEAFLQGKCPSSEAFHIVTDFGISKARYYS